MSFRDLAAALASARKEKRQVPLGDGWPPKDDLTAQGIRDAAFAALNDGCLGYKIGATSPEAQQIMGCSEPFYGAMPMAAMCADGQTFALPEGILGIECEFAFLIGTDQQSGTSYDRDSVAGLVKSCHPALEIIGRRSAGEGFPTVTEAIADFALNIGFVPGPAIENWRNIALESVPVTGFVGDEQTNQGNGSLVLGHPLNALAWLANALDAAGKGLKAGEWISTGTCLGVVPAQKGTFVAGKYGDFGVVSVHLA